MRHLGIALLLVGALGAPAAGKTRVVTSIETFADLARRVGGDAVEVQALARGTMDPHFVEAKPSLLVLLNRADLLVHVGLDLEIGWLPLLVATARNPRIQAGTPGNLDMSSAIHVLDIPTTKVDRSMGDIHPRGNPHYWIPPENASLIAGEIAARLAQLDPAGAPAFQRNLAAFRAELAAKRAAWEKAAAPLRGVKVVAYHKSWSYLSSWLGLVEVGYVEPKPGVPPPQSHVAQLVQLMRAQGVRAVLMESFYSRRTAEAAARLGGAKLAVLPSDVGATPEVTGYFSLVDAQLAALLAAAR